MVTRTFALIVGIAYLAAGAFGFVPQLLGAPPASGPHVTLTAFYGYLLGLFPVNYMHNLMNLALGAWGIAASRAAGGARAYTRSVAVIFGALAILGMFPQTQTIFGLIPIHGNDVWVHAATAIAAAFVGWVVNHPEVAQPHAAVR